MKTPILPSWRRPAVVLGLLVSLGRTTSGLAQMKLAPPESAAPPELKDIAPPLDVFPYPLWMVVLASTLALALLLVIALLVRRAIRNRPPPIPPSPRSIAQQELERLRSVATSTAPYQFSIAVSDVLRRFIRAQFGIRATEQTSPEFLASLSNSPLFSADDRALLAPFLEKCDMIKFARFEATAADNGELLNSASALVQGTRA